MSPDVIPPVAGSAAAYLESWQLLAASVVPSLAGAFGLWLRYRDRREHRAAIKGLSATDPSRALELLERMAPPVGPGTTPLILLLLGACLGLLSCVPPLQVHERMAGLSAAARARCQRDAAACPGAELCATEAKAAGQAIQAARELAARDEVDAQILARSIAAPAVADAVCTQLGFKVAR